MSIILPNAEDIRDVESAGTINDGAELTRRQRKQLERQMENETRKLLKPAQLLHINVLARSIESVANSLTETDISFLALVELMEEKGIITKEEVMEKEQEVFKRLSKVRETPNSPAAQEAKEAADDETTVERLDEVPPTVTETDDEAMPSRIVEG